MFFHYHYHHHHYIQWWESTVDKSPPLSLLSKPHHGGFLTGGNMPVSHDDADDIAQEIMMLLIGESSMSHAHLVNGAVVNVRARVRLILSFFRDDRF